MFILVLHHSYFTECSWVEFSRNNSYQCSTSVHTEITAHPQQR